MMEIISKYYDFSAYHPQLQGWIIGAILAAATIAGTLLGNRSAKKRQQQSLQDNMMLQKQEFDQNKEMWELQNKYNDPSAQMKRLEGAGLNPMQIYGSGSGAANQAAPAPRYEAPTADYRAPINIPDMLGMYQNFQMKQAQVDNVKAQTQNIHADIMNKAIAKKIAEIRGETMGFDLERRKYLAPYQAAIIGNQARGSEAVLQQEWQKLRNLSKDEQIKLLVEQQKTSQIRGQNIQNDQRAADLLFQKYRNQWMKEGVTTSDHPLLRIFVRMMAESGLSDYNPFHSKAKP